MKRADLETLELDKEVIDKIMKLHGSDVEENKGKLADLQEKLDNANTQIADMSEKVKTLDEKDTTVAELQKQLDDYKVAETERIENEKKVAEENAFLEKINPLFEEMKIKDNPYIRNGLIADAKAKMSEDNTLGLKDILSGLTKDNADVFENPNKPLVIPPSGSPNSDMADINKVRSIMGLPPKED